MLSEFGNGVSRLSEQERRMVGLLATGKTPAEVAERLFLSVKTVEWSLAKIDRKLRVPGSVPSTEPELRRER
jgi:DNA-binding CsgD family transcriptional regulator